MIAMVDRLNKNSGVATAFVHGFGLKAGAMASTHNAVCENSAIVGMNGADMAFAEEKLREMGGGQVIVRNGEVIAAFPMPMLGLSPTGLSRRFSPNARKSPRRRAPSAATSTIRCSSLSSPSRPREFLIFACRKRAFCARAPVRGWRLRSTRERRPCGELFSPVRRHPTCKLVPLAGTTLVFSGVRR